jgi:hypothetical protein
MRLPVPNRGLEVVVGALHRRKDQPGHRLSGVRRRHDDDSPRPKVLAVQMEHVQPLFQWKAVSADCRKAVEGLSSEAVAPYAPFGLAALDALDNSHTEAAQALTGSLIDSLLTAYFGKYRYKYTPAKNGKRTTEPYEEFTIRQFVAFAPMWQVYQQFWVEDGDRIPTTFSRNATAHTVSARQFNRRNAVQALLFATSLLFFFDEQASRRKAA